MPTYVAPRSDATRLSMLKTALTTGQQDANAGTAYLSQELLTSLSDLVGRFEPAINLVAEKLGDRSKEVREREAAISRLVLHVRDLWEVLRRRVVRLEQPAEVLSYYKLPQDGTNPVVNSQSAWLTMAAQVIDGDAAAVKAGYPAMVNPGAEEVSRVLADAQRESDEVAPADRAYDDAQRAVADLRPEVDEALEEVMAELRFSLRKREPSNQRRVMRTYGATFEYGESEAALNEAESPDGDTDVSGDAASTEPA